VRVQKSVPPAAAILLSGKLKTKPRTERLRSQIAQPASIARVPKALQHRPARITRLATDWTGSWRNPAIADVEERHKQPKTVELPQRRKV
jgi:hypothetical protein